MISPDLLHQVIKGSFKDHVAIWIVDYIQATNIDMDANHILDELDHCDSELGSHPGQVKEYPGS